MDLIKIEEREGKETVSARVLHKFSESKQAFSTWLRNRIERYEFEKGNDFIVIDNSVNNTK